MLMPRTCFTILLIFQGRIFGRGSKKAENKHFQKGKVKSRIFEDFSPEKVP
jgi:hypothetical protein